MQGLQDKIMPVGRKFTYKQELRRNSSQTTELENTKPIRNFNI